MPDVVPMKVVGYIRVSTSEQASEGVSLDSQRRKLQLFAQLHNLDLVAVEVDAGISAKSLDRPGLASALARLDRGEAEGIVIAKLDRLSRSVSDWNDLIEGYFGPSAGKQLFSVGDSIDTTKAAGRLVLNVLMSVAQWERETIVERTCDARDHKRSQGHAIGHAPYGRRIDSDGRTLVEEPAEVAALDEMKRRASEGWTLRSIAEDLDRRGVPTKRGGKWSHVVVGRLIRADRPSPAARGPMAPAAIDPLTPELSPTP